MKRDINYPSIKLIAVSFSGNRSLTKIVQFRSLEDSKLPDPVILLTIELDWIAGIEENITKLIQDIYCVLSK